jgi:hypothetical protein
MTSRFLIAFLLSLFVGAGAQAGNLEKPDYPLSANEQLYADLAKLPPAERQAKLVEGAKKEAKLELIQAVGGQLGRGITKVFYDAYPFVKVQETNLGTNFAMERIVVEERAGKHITDVTGGDLTEASFPLEYGFLARYPTPATNKVLPQYRGMLDQYHRWVAYSWLEKGVSYNAKMLKEADYPTDWFSVCDKKHANNFSLEPARVRFVTFLKNMLGEEKMIEWLKCVGENDPIIMRGATVRIELMLAGDHAIQGENSLYQGAQLVVKRGADKVPFRMVTTVPLMAQPSTCVINRMAPNPYGAALFCDSVLEQGTQQWMFDNFRNPMTMPSAFIPTEATLIPVAATPVSEAERLLGLYTKYIGSKK